MHQQGNKMTEQEMVPFTAEIKVSDFEKSLKFYTEVLGFEILRISDEEQFATLIFNNGQFLIQGMENPPKPAGLGVFFRFMIHDDIQKYHDLVKGRGAKITKPLEKMSYGMTRFYAEDLDGYQIKFVQKS